MEAARKIEQAVKVDKLYFVYNADSGFMGAALDSAKKILRLQGCTLCSITHGVAGEKGDWKKLKRSLQLPIEYIHRDELTDQMRELIGDRPPAVIAEAGGEKIHLLNHEVLSRCRGDVGDFLGRLKFYSASKGLEID